MNSSTAAILLVVLLPATSPRSPTQPAPMVLAPHTIFFPRRSCAG
jgi:hypothetical protein